MNALNREFIRLVAASGWNQQEVARQLDLTPGAVSHIINGRNNPSPTVVRLLKLIVESTPASGHRKPPTRDQQILEVWELRLLKKLRKLRRDRRERVLGALDAMITAVG